MARVSLLQEEQRLFFVFLHLGRLGNTQHLYQGCPTYSLPGCVMWPTAAFVIYVSAIKITQLFKDYCDFYMCGP